MWAFKRVFFSSGSPGPATKRVQVQRAEAIIDIGKACGVTTLYIARCAAQKKGNEQRAAMQVATCDSDNSRGFAFSSMPFYNCKTGHGN